VNKKINPQRSDFSRILRLCNRMKDQPVDLLNWKQIEQRLILMEKCDANKYIYYLIYLVPRQNSFLLFKYGSYYEMCHCLIEDE
jgi:hypothetical protein